MSNLNLDLVKKSIKATYGSYTDFCEWHDINQSLLSAVLNGKRQSSYKFAMKLSEATGLDPRLVCDEFTDIIEFTDNLYNRKTKIKKA